ncbi:MAG TPA: hypothetical protein VGG94_02330 [Chthoniobacterales bacterium]
MKKLGKLKQKFAAGPKKKKSKAKGKKKDKGKKSGKSKKAGRTAQAAAPAGTKKRGHKLSSEGRAKLRALMKARWAAKRAAAGQGQASADAEQPA